jgi:hypothetical protein
MTILQFQLLQGTESGGIRQALERGGRGWFQGMLLSSLAESEESDENPQTLAKQKFEAGSTRMDVVKLGD